MTLQEAQVAVASYLDELGQSMGMKLAVIPEETVEFGSGWMFSYQSKQFLDSGDTLAALAGNAPLIVSKRTGHVTVTGTAHPMDFYIREFEKSGG